MSFETELSSVKSKVKDLEERIDIIEQKLHETPRVIEKQITLKEFLLSKDLKGDVQKTLAICYFLEIYKGYSYFNVKDLANSFKKAKEPIPNNINYKIIRNIAKGFIEECDEKKDGLKAWCLTQSGIKCVETNFGNKK